MFRRKRVLELLASRSTKNIQQNSVKRTPKAPLLAERLECRLTPAAFTPGDIVVVRVGTGAAALTSGATPIFLDEYTQNLVLVQSVALPTGGSNPLTMSGTATSEGLATLSQNGQYIAVPGYDAAPGVASIALTPTTGTGGVLREVGLVDSSGAVASNTTTTSFSAGDIRSAITTGTGTNPEIWMTGSNTGVVANTAGGSGAGTIVSLSPATNLNALNIFGGQLYVSSWVSQTRSEPPLWGQVFRRALDRAL